MTCHSSVWRRVLQITFLPSCTPRRTGAVKMKSNVVYPSVRAASTKSLRELTSKSVTINEKINQPKTAPKQTTDQLPDAYKFEKRLPKESSFYCKLVTEHPLTSFCEYMCLWYPWSHLWFGYCCIYVFAYDVTQYVLPSLKWLLPHHYVTWRSLYCTLGDNFL